MNNEDSGSKELEKHRILLKALDARLIQTVSERMVQAKKIGELKKTMNLDPYQPDMYQEVVRYYMSEGSAQGLEMSFTLLLADLLHQESLRIQNKIKSGHE